MYSKPIAMWLKESDEVLSFLIAYEDMKIGTLMRKSEQEFTSCAKITLRKCAEPCKNRSGFYVESIIPIPEIADK